MSSLLIVDANVMIDQRKPEFCRRELSWILGFSLTFATVAMSPCEFISHSSFPHSRSMAQKRYVEKKKTAGEEALS